jgi:hypothetical protein
VFKAIAGLNPQVKRKILSDKSQAILRDLKDHSFSLPIRRFERLEQSAAVERLERAAVIGERLNRPGL